MKTFFKILIIFSIVFFIGSCSDPIFYTVFQETPILKPYIDGSPTNFAVFNGSLYVASGKKIFAYKNGTWSEWKKLNDRIGALAATTSSLYALYLEDDSGNGKIINLTSGSNLSLSEPNNAIVKSIHADEDILFVSAIVNNSYNIYYRKDSDSDFTIILEKTNSWLAGVASDLNYYYLCVGSSIYCVDKLTIEPDTDNIFTTDDKAFTGIVKINDDYCAAISDNGKIYEIENGAISSALTDKFTDGRSSTGAIAVYKNTDDEPSLLLVGRKENFYTTSSGYTNGYVEITLDTTGKITGSFNEPGKNTPSSVDDYDRFVSSLGKEPINHIIQTPAAIDPSMRLLASTQQHGVWSYRDRGDSKGMRWNSEQP
jgi:hypothetical protein